VGRSIAVITALALAAPAGGAVRARTMPAPAPRDEPVLAHISSHVARASRPPAGTLVARIRPGRDAVVRSSRGLERVGSHTQFGSPQTFPVTRLLPGRRYRVLLDDGRTGWIRPARGTFTLRRTRVSLEVDLSTSLLRVHRGNRVTRSARVGIGAPGTPTPVGRFAVTDKLDGAAFSPVYGCCILALSAHQSHLPAGWTGGNLIAIHGGSTAGAISNGCVHAATADLLYLMRMVPLGTPVVVHP
jgi:lipoprotein-anchoring transpeptidase ErfK/SrfK